MGPLHTLHVINSETASLWSIFLNWWTNRISGILVAKLMEIYCNWDVWTLLETEKETYFVGYT